jgi:hypothetical protein
MFIISEYKNKIYEGAESAEEKLTKLEEMRANI